VRVARESGRQIDRFPSSYIMKTQVELVLVGSRLSPASAGSAFFLTCSWGLRPKSTLTPASQADMLIATICQRSLETLGSDRLIVAASLS
jgi:hypothetical protein